MKHQQDPRAPGMPYTLPLQSVIPPLMKPYYPFAEQHSAYQYSVPYQYPPPPPYFYLMNKRGFPQMPFNYRPEPVVPCFRLNR